ncbi:MAG: helix-turn-helix transcriptional regulator [Thermovenabulum sp.]|uniref:helix-turn-helix transcriptional regulator n=1 Tax=Thermovenabulum sp. TaxID=3100335 RepID=UPI003C7A412D
MRINERLKKIRKSKGITQTYIARKMGKTCGWYSNIERGNRKLSAEDAKKIADILGVDIKEIFFENELNATFNEPEQKTA